MADADDKEKQEAQEKKDEKKKDEKKKDKQEDKKSEADGKKSLVSRLLPGLIIAVVMVVFASAGFTLSRLFAGSDVPESSEQDQLTQAEDAEDSADDSQKGWYYNLEPVVANLDVPEVTRYVRATLILEISPDMDEKEGTAFLDEKKPVLTNWLTVYLASLSINDIRGESNLKRVQSQILDAFNEKLFPDSKPKIKHILFKEFAVQ
ncbi:MAG: flagellar basal body-associated FliL family protein [Phycisphaerales bacterium]|jgi:flagellar basal body-associated protein FliL